MSERIDLFVIEVDGDEGPDDQLTAAIRKSGGLLRTWRREVKGRSGEDGNSPTVVEAHQYTDSETGDQLQVQSEGPDSVHASRLEVGSAKNTVYELRAGNLAVDVYEGDQLPRSEPPEVRHYEDLSLILYIAAEYEGSRSA